MGFLEDLVKTVQEAVEEAREGQGPPRSQPPSFPRRPPPAAPDDPDATATRERLRRRYEEARRAELENAEIAARRQHSAEVREADTLVDQTPGAAGTAAASGIAAHHTPPSAGWQQIVHLLQDPRAAREAILMREILDRPLALRRRSGR